MLGVSRLHLLVLRSFVWPFLGSFAVALVILTLQFLARYQDDIFGKGLGAGVILMLFGLTSIQLSVMSLPLALLMGSLMTIGRMGENSELAALKACGVGLTVVIKPLLWVAIAVMACSFYLTAFLVPQANLRLYTLLFDAQRSRPQLLLQPGYFENAIKGFTLYFRKRLPSGKLQDLKIWDHQQYVGDVIVLSADSADLFIDDSLLYMNLVLYKGIRYEERQFEPMKPDPKLPFARLNFDTLIYRLDVSGFGFYQSDVGMFQSHQYMLESPKLWATVDSLRNYRQESVREQTRVLRPYFVPDSTRPWYEPSRFAELAQHSPPPPADPRVRQVAVAKALNNSRSLYNHIEFVRSSEKNRRLDLLKFECEWYNRLAIPLTSLLFLVIGASLGAIIRKGGIGYPTLFAVLFFIVNWVLMTQGKKLAREDLISPAVGMNLSLLLLTPVGLLLLWQAATDSPVLQLSFWRRLISR
jgi:lipopolysaccharide export system permease protein